MNVPKALLIVTCSTLLGFVIAYGLSWVFMLEALD